MEEIDLKKEEFALTPANKNSNFIQTEVNLEKLPFFTSNKTSKFDIANQVMVYHKEIFKDGMVTSLTWKVMASSGYGLPNHLDRDIYRCLQKIIAERGILPNGYITFSICEIINLLGHKKSGYISSKIKVSLERMVATTVKSEGAFYSKEKKTHISDTFHLFESFTAKNKELNNGDIADTNYLKLGTFVLNSILSGYVKPVDFDYYISLKSINAKALYSRLSVDFYGLPDNVECLTKKYSELCNETLITYQHYPSLAKNYVKKAFEELISTGFLLKVEFKPILNNSHDFYIDFYPGERAKDQYKFRNVLLPETEVFEPSQQLRAVENKKAQPIQESKSTLINEVVESVKDQLSEEDLILIDSLIKLGMSEDKSKECVTKHKEKTIYWLKAKDHYSKSKPKHNLPGFLYTGITSNWISGPYEEYLKKQELKQRQKQEEQKKIEEDKKLIQSSAKGWEEWINLTNVIESLDVDSKQALYNFVKNENKCHPFYSRLEVNQPLTVTTLTGLKDSFICGIKTLNIDVKGFKHLLD